MIKISNLQKKYGKTVILKDINITFPEKGLVSILGKSGSGKSTLLNILGGIDSCNKGKVVIKDIDIAKASRSKIDVLRRNEIGFVFQDYSLVENMTVYDNIKVSLDILCFSDKEEIKKRISSALSVVDLSGFEKRLVSNLSGGQQQRVSIARALVKDPSIMLCDEPTGNLDSKNTLKVMEELKAISKNKLVILVTHEKDIADFYSDRIITIKDGSIVSDTHEQTSTLDRKEESDFYLKDLDKEEFTSKKLFGRFFKDKNSNEENELTVIVQNNKVYLKSEKNTVLDISKNNRYRFINESYNANEKNQVKDSKGIEVNFKSNSDVKKKLAIVDILHEGFSNFRNMYKTKRKYIRGTLVYGFVAFLLSMFIITGISYQKGNKYYTNMYDERYSYLIERNIGGIDVFDTYADKFSFNESSLSVKLGNIDGSAVNAYLNINSTVLSEDFINSNDKYMGKINNLENNEVVISNLIADEILYNKTSKTMNITSYESLLGKRTWSNAYYSTDTPDILSEFKIVGIVYSDVMTSYYSKSTYNFKYVQSYSGFGDNEHVPMYESSKDLIYKSASYNDPLKDYEALVTEDYLLENQVSIGDTIEIREKNFQIVGTYDGYSYMDNFSWSDPVIVVNDEMADALNLSRWIHSNYYRDADVLYTDNIDSFREELDSIEGLKYLNSNYWRITYQKWDAQGSFGAAIFLSVILFITMFIVFRIDLLKRTKILGVSRILGRSNKSIILASTLQSAIMFVLFAGLGVTGGVLMSQFIESFAMSYQYMDAIITVGTAILAYILIFGVMLLANLLALVTVVLRKEPINLIRAHDV